MANPTTATFLLAEFVDIARKDDILLEIGTGGGDIAWFLSQKYPQKKIVALDIQKNFWKLWRDLKSPHLFFIVGDGKRKYLPFKANSISVLVANPPFYTRNSHRKSPAGKRITARFEAELSFAQLCSSARYLLKEKGKFFFIHSAFRFAEIIREMDKYDLWPQKVEFVTTKKGKPCEYVLVKSIFKGRGETLFFHRILI